MNKSIEFQEESVTYNPNDNDMDFDRTKRRVAPRCIDNFISCVFLMYAVRKKKKPYGRGINDMTMRKILDSNGPNSRIHDFFRKMPWLVTVNRILHEVADVRCGVM